MMALMKAAFLALCIVELTLAKPVLDVDADSTNDSRQKRMICITCIDPCMGPSCGGGPPIMNQPFPVPSPVPVPVPVPQPQPQPMPVPVPVPMPQPQPVPVPVPVPGGGGCAPGMCITTCISGPPC